MTPITITDVRVFPGDGAFLLDDGKTAVLYDTGYAFTGSRIAENIRKVLGERQLDYSVCIRYDDGKYGKTVNYIT